MIHAKLINFDVSRDNGWYRRYPESHVYRLGKQRGDDWKAELLSEWVEFGGSIMDMPLKLVIGRLINVFLVGVGLLIGTTAALAQDVDILIRGGLIVDGTGNPSFLGDVAIRGDRIVAMGRLGSPVSKRVLDAKALIVAPGFIDIHNHSDYSLITDGNAQSMTRQGVTSMILGEGESAGPIGGLQIRLFSASPLRRRPSRLDRLCRLLRSLAPSGNLYQRRQLRGFEPDMDVRPGRTVWTADAGRIRPDAGISP